MSSLARWKTSISRVKGGWKCIGWLKVSIWKSGKNPNTKFRSLGDFSILITTYHQIYTTQPWASNTTHTTQHLVVVSTFLCRNAWWNSSFNNPTSLWGPHHWGCVAMIVKAKWSSKPSWAETLCLDFCWLVGEKGCVEVLLTIFLFFKSR